MKDQRTGARIVMLLFTPLLLSARDRSTLQVALRVARIVVGPERWD